MRVQLSYRIINLHFLHMLRLFIVFPPSPPTPLPTRFQSFRGNPLTPRHAGFFMSEASRDVQTELRVHAGTFAGISVYDSI